MEPFALVLTTLRELQLSERRARGGSTSDDEEAPSRRVGTSGKGGEASSVGVPRGGKKASKGAKGSGKAAARAASSSSAASAAEDDSCIRTNGFRLHFRNSDSGLPSTFWVTQHPVVDCPEGMEAATFETLCQHFSFFKTTAASCTGKLIELAPAGERLPVINEVERALSVELPVSVINAIIDKVYK